MCLIRHVIMESVVHMSVILLVPMVVSGQSDPCLTAVTLPRAAYRGGKCDYNVDKPVCDRLLPEVWYRANTTAGDLKLQDTQPDLLKCGTKFPYWMNGTHPTIADDVVDRTVCVVTTSSNCTKDQQIQVKNCGTYYVYNLTGLPTCNEGYCFGETSMCPPFDPCDVYEYTELNFDKDQSKTCVKGDCGNIDASRWYSYKGGESITKYLNQTYSNCSSGKRVSVNDTSTPAANGIQNFTLCVHVKNNTCSETVHAYSKQCNGYTVYNLPNVLSTTCQKICSNSKHKWHVCEIPPDKGNGQPAMQVWSFYFAAVIILSIIII